MAEMTTGGHNHCFCAQNTVGVPMCCMCGITLGSTIINLDALLIQHQVEHLKREGKKVKGG